MSPYRPGSKIRLAVAIHGILENLTRQEAAKQPGTKQPNVSAPRNAVFEGFSAERLMHDSGGGLRRILSSTAWPRELVHQTGFERIDAVNGS
jgi:hypothetical protein